MFIIVFLLLIAAIIGIIWGIYLLFFKKDYLFFKRIDTSDEYRTEFDVSAEMYEKEAEHWERMMDKQLKEDADFYRRMGKLEQQLEDLEKLQKPKRRRRKK